MTVHYCTEVLQEVTVMMTSRNLEDVATACAGREAIFLLVTHTLH
jgi:hypothetical protein